MPLSSSIKNLSSYHCFGFGFKAFGMSSYSTLSYVNSKSAIIIFTDCLFS
ncbi:hypothetical protein [uncultured Gammaproteobacteria bacterium]|nr:hypothetical protein [uncultured Gammaproteobacteria bacterium]CAC9468439.1 hypothetical protein [uncultured Gammaproteobacteria bacterium]